MRTAHALTVSPIMLCARGGAWFGGGAWSRGVCAWSGGGGVPGPGGCLVRGCVPGLGGGPGPGGVVP